MGVAQAGQQQLPTETNEFVGRAAELHQLGELLREARLVTLVGPGGVGKTRVAIRAANGAAPRFEGQVFLVELSALRDPGLLSHTVARRLGLAEQARDSQRDALLAHLSTRRLLLVLDTCEHLIDGCAELAEAILTGAPDVTVLATSREPLDVDGETTLPIRPLPVPVPTGVAGEEPGSDAVELFVRRAAAATGRFVMTDANRADVIRVCQRLDGIPLAIELAAVRLRALPLSELAARLEDRPMLDGDDTGRGGRHRTLRDAIGWSYELCTVAERTLWARLSVFAGPFNVAAAKEVCASVDLDGDGIFETIIRLVDKNVLVRTEPPTTGGMSDADQPAWYRMLDTIHEYGAEMLHESGCENAMRDRFVARYLAKARYFADHLTDEEQLTRFRELRREHNNIRAALQYTIGDGPQRQRQGADLTIALYGYWHMSGLLAEGRYWLGKVLERRPETASAERGWALACRCYLGAMQGTADEAVAEGQEAIRIGDVLGDQALIARGYCYLALALTIAGQYAQAADAATQAERALEALGDRTGLAILDAHWAHLSHLAGDPEATLRYAARGLGRFDGAKEWWASAWMHVISGMALYGQPGRSGETARAVNKSLVAKHELGDMVGTAYCLEIHGWLAARADRPVRAAWLLGAAKPLWERAGGRLGGTAALEQVHEASIAASKDALGSDRFDSLFCHGATAELDSMVALALCDAEAPGSGVPAIPQPSKLTERESEVAYLAAAGLTAEQIARQLFQSERTVEEHLRCVFDKLRVSSADQLGLWLGEQRTIPIQR